MSVSVSVSEGEGEGVCVPLCESSRRSCPVDGGVLRVVVENDRDGHSGVGRVREMLLVCC